MGFLDVAVVDYVLGTVVVHSSDGAVFSRSTVATGLTSPESVVYAAYLPLAPSEL